MDKPFTTMSPLDVSPQTDLQDEQPVPKWIRDQKRRPWGSLSPIFATLLFLLPSFVVNRFRKTTASRLHPTAYLDGLRGVAALFVYICHYTLCWRHALNAGYGSPGDNSYLMQLPFIRLVYAGTASVRVFFVISGFVLSIKTLKLIHRGGDQLGAILQTLAGATFRRSFRLYLPIVVITALSAVLVQITPEPAGYYTRDYVTRSGPPRLYPNMTAQFAEWTDTMLNMFEPFHVPQRVNPLTNYAGQLWTIPIEFKGSIIVFVLLLAFSRVRRWVAALTVFGVGVFWQYQRQDVDMGLFCAGMLLAELGVVLPPGSVSGWLGRRGFGRPAHLLHHGVVMTLFFFALFMLSFPEMQPESSLGFEALMPITPLKFRGTGIMGLPPSINLQVYWTSLGAILIILTLMYSPPAKMPAPAMDQDLPRVDDKASMNHHELDQNPSSSSEPLLQRLFTNHFSQYLGRISFSLYLTHNMINHLVGVHWSNPGFLLWYTWEKQNGEHMKQHSVLAALEAALESQAPLPWDNRGRYWGLLAGGWLVNTIAVFWVADVFTRAVDEPCVRFARWLGRCVEVPKEKDGSRNSCEGYEMVGQVDQDVEGQGATFEPK